MSFLSPMFLAGIVAAALPVLLHLLKRHPELHVRFAAVRFLQHAPVEHARQRHLRELLLLLLRVAALVALAAAFARPYVAAAPAGTGDGAVVIALDTSLSMSAPQQFEKARRLAKEAVSRSRSAAVVTFDDTATIASRLSDDRALAVDAIDKASAGMGSTHYRGAIATAAELLRGVGGRVLVVTDLQAQGWDAGDRLSIPAAIQVDVADVGAPPANRAVTDVRAEDGRLVATVANMAPSERAVAVEAIGFFGLSAAGTPVAAPTTVRLGGGQSMQVSLPLPSGRWAAVRVDDPDGMAGDNSRYVMLDQSAQPNVLVVTTNGDLDHDAFYVGRALRASAPGSAALGVEAVSGATLGIWDQTRLDRAVAILLLSTRGLEHRARSAIAAYVQNGGGLVVAVGPDIDADLLGESLGGIHVRLTPSPVTGLKTIADVDSRHPVMREFAGASSLGFASFRTVDRVQAEGCDTLARFTSSEPALVECESGKGRVLLFASDLNNQWNDLPKHATFLPLLHEMVRHLSAAGRLPSARPSDLKLAQPGVVEIPARAGMPARLVAVNADPAESSAERMTVEQFAASIEHERGASAGEARESRVEIEGRQRLWQYVLAAMILLLVAESAVAQRVA